MSNLTAIVVWPCYWTLIGATARLIYPSLTDLSLRGTFLLGLAGSLLGGLFWLSLGASHHLYRPGGWLSGALFALGILATRRFDGDGRWPRRIPPPWSFIY
jgi:uncharacterized membrane protein YeaQ/YmgE (transglycosylase-associated protein family)